MEARKDKYHGQERRRYSRLPGTMVEYFPLGKNNLKKSSFTENVSPVGICFLTDEKIEVDTILSLRIHLPNSKDALEAKGKVIWTNVSAFLSVEKASHYDVGVEIIEIDETDRVKIEKYIAMHISDE
jgi:Tfp pilus assembly protein PilZ